jgi:hypothetical protein
MACTRPLNAYRSAVTGKVLFRPFSGCEFISLPCGQCIGCRLERSRDWAVRCVHESKLWKENCFITLTYNNENLPAHSSLVRQDLTKFFKRLRKRYNHQIRYFACGEYGDKLHRPHYHAILFNHDFQDKFLFQNGKFPLYISPALNEIWPFGHSVVAGFSFESAAYTARYCVKKITGKDAREHYGDRLPEFSAMSRRPGIGHDFFYKYYDDIVNYDTVVTRNGVICRPPRYYDKLLSGCDVELLEKHKEKRISNAQILEPERLRDLDRFNEIKFSQMMRKYENGS